MAAIDTHIKFPGAPGESQHQDHKGEIELMGWSHNVSNIGQSSGGGHGKGKAVAGDFSIHKRYDKASPILMKKCAEGEHFSEVIVTSRKSGSGQKDFLKITMKEVFITSIGPSGGGGGDINEGVSMSFGEIEYHYQEQNDKGATGGPVKFGWNVKTTKIT